MKRSRSEDVEEQSKWRKLWSKTHQRFYWFQRLTGESVWEEPKLIVPTISTTTTTTATTASSSEISSASKDWVKQWSTKHNLEYWYNQATGATVWDNPNISSYKSEQLLDMLRTEKLNAQVEINDCPRISQNINYPNLISRLIKERADVIHRTSSSEEFQIIFVLKDDDTAMLTRSIQEDQILKTRLKLRQNDRAVDLPSFWEVWSRPESTLRIDVLSSVNPLEAKWTLQKKHGYKMATTFMPGYAKAIYEYFKAKTILDPCAGWGDRLAGATSAQALDPSITRYLAFDPNRDLRPGYAEIMKLFGYKAIDGDATKLKFTNNFEIHSQPFEVGAVNLISDTFDLVFTSPPFFDYEMYNPNNPDYKDWIGDFYVPLMKQSCRVVKPGCHVAIHIGDTSAGAIVPFLKEQVHKICPLRLVYQIGLRGVMSDKLRPVWIFQKSEASSIPSQLSVSSSSSSKMLTLNKFFNPKVRISCVVHNDMKFILYDDAICVGGTKQRLLFEWLKKVPEQEIIYAGPDGGMAQVALAVTARALNKRAVIYLNTSSSQQSLPPLAKLAQLLGADLRLAESVTGRTLKDTQHASEVYASADSGNRFLVPFGLHAKPNEPAFNMFREAILASLLPNIPPPNRLWVVAGSGFLFSVLHSIFPSTEFMIVQVGRKIWPDQLAGIKHQFFVAPESFADLAVHQPPYKTVPWYDAKLWQFVLKHGLSNDAIWNVGMAPDEDNVERVALNVLSLLDSVHTNR